MSISSSRFVCAAAIALIAACSTPFKSIKFPVPESGGGSIVVEKFFNDGLGVDEPAANAFKAAQANDLAGALVFMKEGVAKQPNNEWDRYNLGILYEANGQWENAATEMKEAQRVLAEKKGRKPEPRFAEELAFIEAHQPKK